MVIDERLVGALHVEAMRAADLHGGAEPHETFQASTITALLDGAYDGDVSFAELRQHGDLGLGTLDACDGVAGTMVGFRFPDYAEGLNVPGYHLHFVDSDRQRGGHVLDCVTDEVSIAIDDSVDLHAELPPGVELTSCGDSAALDAVDRVER